MKIAGVQMDVQLGEPATNLGRIESKLLAAVSDGAELVIFPECAVTGYCFESREAAREFAQTVPGPATEQVSAWCAELNCYAAFGMLEANGDGYFNAAVLVGADGVVAIYRKVHLPFLGADMFADYGDRPFEVAEITGRNGEAVRVALNICYDSAFPEASRCLTLQGADLIILPTNWPTGAECLPEHVVNTRAMENSIYYAAVNRVGTEAGFQFIGRSRISAPNGQTLAAGSADEEEILYAEIDTVRSRNKLVVRKPGLHAIDRLADRRPHMYGPLIEAHNLTPPGRGE